MQKIPAQFVLKPSLQHLLLVLTVFYVGFLSGLTFNEVCGTKSWYNFERGLKQVAYKNSREVFEDNVHKTGTTHALQCDQLAKITFNSSHDFEAKSNDTDLLNPRLQPQIPLNATEVKLSPCEEAPCNKSGWICRPPSLVDQLPSGYVQKTTDYYHRRLFGIPEQDLQVTPKNLLAIAVGIKQNASVNAMIQKFPKENFTVLLFHYDNAVNEWGHFEWNERVIHIQSTAQSKWWFAKRFLHPDVVQPYENIFLWDEDLGVQNFDPLEYLNIVKRHGLHISQPAVEGHESWPITVRQWWTGKEVHKRTPWENLGDNCTADNNKPPCAGFVEIMAPVFNQKAWHCVWHLIQNDLVLAWGLDFRLQVCIDGPPHEHIGIVDTQWVEHKSVASLGSQGAGSHSKQKREEVIGRSFYEWGLANNRWKEALDSMKEVQPPDSTIRRLP